MTTEEQHKERIRLWVEALRSGDYHQGRGSLTSQGGFFTPDGLKPGDLDCCLGVACKIAINHGVPVTVDREADTVAYDGIPDLLPHSVSDWFGLEEPDPMMVEVVSGEYLCADGTYPSLVSLNDSGFTFAQIADLIEWYYLYE